ncbi:MAG: helix-turn-helix transcriptional regulator [Bacteroidetes bacterium]|nr:helix-turn-helix transcriptional regulator [Bacteroidota bacterium]
MKYTGIGAFEELVLLMIGVLDEDAYGVAIKEEIAGQTGKRPSIGALHSALKRLEGKGLISSHEGGATQERGGRRKRFYQLTNAGKEALMESYQLRNNLFKQIKGLAWD